MGYGNNAKACPWKMALQEIATHNTLLAERLKGYDYPSLWLSAPEKISPAIYLALCQLDLFDLERGRFKET